MPTYIVTGANRGLGLEFVRQLSSGSNKIIATTRSLSSDLSDLKSLNSNNNITILECDTSSPASIKTFTTSVAEHLGSETKIDFLLNNAGINSDPSNTSLSLKDNDISVEVQTNVLGPAKTVEYLLSANLLAKNVRVLNMTSGLGSMEVSASIEPRKCMAYSISKAGVNMLTVHQTWDVKQALGQDAQPVIICMDPGWVKTRMGGDGAILEAEESIGGMLKVLHKIESKDSGKFFRYDGEQVGW